MGPPNRSTRVPGLLRRPVTGPQSLAMRCKGHFAELKDHDDPWATRSVASRLATRLTPVVQPALQIQNPQLSTTPAAASEFRTDPHVLFDRDF